MSCRDPPSLSTHELNDITLVVAWLLGCLALMVAVVDVVFGVVVVSMVDVVNVGDMFVGDGVVFEVCCVCYG